PTAPASHGCGAAVRTSRRHREAGSGASRPGRPRASPASLASPCREGSVVPPGDLVHSVREERPEHLDAIADTTARPRQVDPQRVACDTGKPTRERGSGHLRHAHHADRLGDPWHLAGDDPPGHFWSEVKRREAGATGGDDEVVRLRNRLTQHTFDRLPVGYDDRAVDVEAKAAQTRNADRSAAILIDAGGNTVGHRDDERPHRSPLAGLQRACQGCRSQAPHGTRGNGGLPPAGSGHARRLRGNRRHRHHLARCQSPDLPPVFDSSRTSVMTAAGSTAFTMSTTVSPATATQVRASISTPVRSAVRTVAVISTASRATAKSTVTPSREMGWTRG